MRLGVGSLIPGAAPDARHAMVAVLAAPLWLLGLVVEALVAYGLARFLARVQPGLLPRSADAAVETGAPAGRPA